jgi:predicted outer membrane repeat protein
MTLLTITLSNNTAGFFGGGLYNDGTSTIDSTTLTGNAAGFYGGGIYTDATLTVSNSTFRGNSPDPIFGDYLDADGNLFG